MMRLAICLSINISLKTATRPRIPNRHHNKRRRLTALFDKALALIVVAAVVKLFFFLFFCCFSSLCSRSIQEMLTRCRCV